MGACVSVSDDRAPPLGGGYAPVVITSGIGAPATLGAAPGAAAAAPAALFAGVGFVQAGAAFPGEAPPVPTQATFVPPPPMAPVGPPPARPPPAPLAVGAPVPLASGGKRKALLVACNYRGTSAELKGCVNDQQCMAFFLQQRFGYTPDSILAMNDCQPNPALWPTRANVLAAMAWLVSDLAPGDHAFFHYSGHGASTRDWSGDEIDGMNETLCPCDFRQAGQIVDDEINAVLVNPVPAGAKLHAVIDACHSGSVLDLEMRTEMGPQGAHWEQEYARQPTRPKGSAGGLAVQFGAARDSQTAADTAALSGTVSTGAATFALIAAVEREGTEISYGRLLESMYATLRASVGVAGAPGSSPTMPSLGGLLGALLGVGGVNGGKGQNPVLSANVGFDLNSPIDL